MGGILINVDPNLLASRIILTDDPFKARMFAAHYLDNAKLNDDTRMMANYTGSYKGVPVTVQSVGIGEVSALAYLHELYVLSRQYSQIDAVIYSGECVSYHSGFQLRDVVLVNGAYEINNDSAKACANEKLLSCAINKAAEFEIKVKASSSITFDRYLTGQRPVSKLGMPPLKNKIAILDFNSYGIYDYANVYDLATLAILTVADESLTGNSATPAERQSTFQESARLSFETIISF